MEFKIEAITLDDKEFESKWQKCDDYSVEQMQQISETLSQSFKKWDISYR